MRGKIVTAHITRQSSSYRHGLVLGLTMAEVMLLLVFCLLIATGVLLSREKLARLDLEQQLRLAVLARDANANMASLIENSPQLREALEQKATQSSSASIDEFWRKLVESAAVVDKLDQAGLAPADAAAEADQFAEAHRLLQKGVSLTQVKADAALGARLRKALAQNTGQDGRASDAAIIETVEKGLANGNKAGHLWPPIIKLSEADGYFFESGKAELQPAFEKTLRTSVIASLLKTARDYDVDVIEVVGHTDEQPVSVHRSNLDQELASSFESPEAIGNLRPSDNAGLGLARAVAVVSVLSADPRLKNYKILPLSGAQLIRPDETLARTISHGEEKQRRRIEIRLRKSAQLAEEATTN